MDRSRNHFDLLANALRRTAWCVLLVSHLNWLVRSFAAADASVPSQVLLGATCLFLSLKTLDVACLRFHCSGRAVIGAVLVVALLHVGVIDRSSDDAFEWTPWVLPALIGGLVRERQGLVGLIRRVAMRLALAFGHPRPQWTRHYWQILAGTRACRRQHAFVTLRTPRGPPI